MSKENDELFEEYEKFLVELESLCLTQHAHVRVTALCRVLSGECVRQHIGFEQLALALSNTWKLAKKLEAQRDE